MSEIVSALFEKGEQVSPDYFTGTVWLKSLVANSPIFNTQIANVVFGIGARTNWHTHPGGQILIVTDGNGYYQEKGKSIQVIRHGDVVTIPPDIEHWHGASPDSPLTHLAINTNSQKGAAVWLQKVTDEEYSALTEKSI